MADPSWRPLAGGVAQRRRERRLRSWYRHEQQTVRMALAAFSHHSALRRQPKEGHEEHDALRRQKPPPPQPELFSLEEEPGGGRPAPLPEVAGWQERLEQHAVEDLGSICPYVQILDLPVLQLVEQPVEVDSFFRNFVPAVAEQVIEVPKLAFPSCAIQRAALSEPQLVEQLVEVPTVLSYSLLQRRNAVQFVDTPVPHGRGGGARGGLQGFSQGQGSAAVSGSVNVYTPVPHGRGGGARGGLQGLSQGQGSTAICEAEYVDTPARGGLQGLSQGQGSTAICEAVNVDTPARGGLQGLSQGQGSTAICEAVNVDTPARGGLQGLSQGQGSTAVYGAEHVDTPVPQGRVGKRDLQGFPRGQSSTASAGEQSIVPACGGLQGLPQGQGSAASAGEQTIVPACGGLQGLPQGQGSTASAGEQTIVPSRGDEVTLLFRKTTESRPQLRVHARRTRPLRFAFKAYCRRFGLQESQVRFYCDGLLSPEHSPGLYGLEDGDVIEAQEVFAEDEEEEEDDDEFGTESRFPDGFLPMRLCRWFPSGNCRQGWGCMFAHSMSELHSLSPEHDL